MARKEKEYYQIKVSRRNFLKGVGAAAVAAAAGVGFAAGRLTGGKETEGVEKIDQKEVTPTVVPTEAAEVVPTVTPTSEASSSLAQEQEVASLEVVERGEPVELFRADEALDYPSLQKPDPQREPVFPDVEKGERPALVAYETPFESGDYFHTGKGDIDIPQYYYRVITAGKIKVDELEINCSSTKEKGCVAIIINHFGDSVMFRKAEVDNGFTVAGRVFDMGEPEKVTEAGQALLDHYLGRMTESEDGANCGTIAACPSVEWHVVVVGNGKPQVHWAGVYTRPETK